MFTASEKQARVTEAGRARVAALAPEWAMSAGIVLILVTGLIHMIDAPSSWDDAPYKGVMFGLNALGAVIAAVGIYRGRMWGWALGLPVASGAFVMYVISRTVGLPGLPVDDWMEPLGLLSLVVEGAFTAVAIYALTAQPARLRAAQN